jgi:lipid A ethanolaminephosphotransferase
MFRLFAVAPWRLALLASAFIVAVNNSQLFRTLFGLLDLTEPAELGFLLCLVLLMVAILNAFILAFGIGPLLKGVIAVFLISSAAMGYFVNELGVVVDQGMLTNIADTVRERNFDEARELASTPFMFHILWFGILPSVVLLFIHLRPRHSMLELRDRAIVIAASAILVISVDLQEDLVFVAVGSDAKQQKAGPKRTVGIMVVGETARADRFSLNGYSRATNPELSMEEGVLFLDADACGTSTAYSVPCMFYLDGRDSYDPVMAAARSNVLDVLTTAGVKTVWIDNNSTCKHVCDRIENENLRIRPDGSKQKDGDYDINLVDAAERHFDSGDADVMIVLHMMGSHGPAYSQRYPSEFALFSPYCEKLSPKECSKEEVGNAYDNSIVYTDYVIAELIASLKRHSEEFDSFLFYASDHGESLGENGVYLHGLPYRAAPPAQTDVPFVLWLSAEYTTHTGVHIGDAAWGAPRRPSHDNIPHTLLGLFGVSTASYRPESDLLANKRSDLRAFAARTTT